MTQGRESVQWKTASGDKVAVGDVAVTPQSQALVVRWPQGGFVWNRPLDLIVEQDGEAKRVPIVDVTRVMTWGLYALAFVFMMIGIVTHIRQERNRNE